MSLSTPCRTTLQRPAAGRSDTAAAAEKKQRIEMKRKHREKERIEKEREERRREGEKRRDSLPFPSRNASQQDKKVIETEDRSEIETEEREREKRR